MERKKNPLARFFRQVARTVTCRKKLKPRKDPADDVTTLTLNREQFQAYLRQTRSQETNSCSPYNMDQQGTSEAGGNKIDHHEEDVLDAQPQGGVLEMTSDLDNSTTEKAVEEAEEPDKDPLVAWFEAGHHGLLEKVLLSLPAKDIRTVQEVSSDWRAMINSYLFSENRRIQKIVLKRQMEKIDFTIWSKGNRFLEIGDIVTDDRDIVVSVLTHFDAMPIFVIDAESLEIVQGLEMFSRKEGYCEVKLAMNDKYLAANVVNLTSEAVPETDQTIWLRDHDRKVHQSTEYYLTPFIYAPTSRPLIARHIKEEPNLSNTGFYSYSERSTNFLNHANRIAFKHFEDVGQECFVQNDRIKFWKTTTDYFVDFKILPGPREAVRALLLESGIRKEGGLQGRVSLLRENGNNIVWEVKKAAHSPKLIGLDGNHLVVAWAEEGQGDGITEILSLADGSVIGSIDLGGLFSKAFRAQAAKGRLAVRVETKIGNYDVIVWDMGSGKVIFKCSDHVADCTYPMFSTFVLEKHRLLFTDSGKLFIANFWV